MRARNGAPQPLKKQVAEPQHLFKMDLVLLQYHTSIRGKKNGGSGLI
jgi:hypothetical protein